MTAYAIRCSHLVACAMSWMTYRRCEPRSRRPPRARDLAPHFVWYLSVPAEHAEAVAAAWLEGGTVRDAIDVLPPYYRSVASGAAARFLRRKVRPWC